MKQPLMIIPPAQAEALYDAALENSEPGKRSRIHNAHAVTGEWDDQGSADSLDDGLFPSSRQSGAPVRPTPQIPFRSSFQ
jgi:hypothetical protein